MGAAARSPPQGIVTSKERTKVNGHRVAHAGQIGDFRKSLDVLNQVDVLGLVHVALKQFVQIVVFSC